MKMHTLTIGQLQEVIKRSGLPDDTPVVYERIEDAYFDNHNWKTVDVDWEVYPWGDRTDYPNPDMYDLRYTAELDRETSYVREDFYGPNGETLMLQSKAIEPWQAYKAWSRSMGCYVLVITPHY
jgi:hypothetical protein